MRTRIFDIGIWNPGEHFPPLCEHLLASRVEVSEDLNGHTDIPN
jgi:hypothetical protein